MGLSHFLTEAPPRIRWQRGRLWTRFVLRRSFGDIGKGSVIVAPLVLRGVRNIHIGSQCAIYENVWLACESDEGRIALGDNVYLGHDVHIHSVDPITIGDGCMIADGVLVSSGEHPPGNNRHIVVSSGPIFIGNRVFLGQRSMVLGGVTIGDGASVGANAVVTRDVAPGAVVAGVPARSLRETFP